jgi:hypothetical protein
LLSAEQSPLHPADSCGAPGTKVTEVFVVQPPVLVQLAWPVALGMLVSLVAVVLAQPDDPEAPVWQVAVALVAALLTCWVGTLADEVASDTRAWHSPVALPVQALVALLVLGELMPPEVAVPVAVPVIEPVQPVSVQFSEEETWSVLELPGTGVPSAPAIPLFAAVTEVAVLAISQPLLPAAVQVAFACAVEGEPAGAPAVLVVSPVVLAVQPGPVHWAAAWELDRVAGGVALGAIAAAALFAAWSAWVAVACAVVAAARSASVAPGAVAFAAASVAAWSAWVAVVWACWLCRARVSATTWPAPAVDWVVAWQPLWVAVQVAEVSLVPAGGPRGSPALPVVSGPWSPVAFDSTVPEQPLLPAVQFSVAEALDQLEAPGTVGDTFAPDPGEPPVPGPVGGVEGCEPELPVELPPPEPLPELAGLACDCPVPPLVGPMF